MRVFEMLDVETVEQFDEAIASCYMIMVVLASVDKVNNATLKNIATRLGMKILEAMSMELDRAGKKHPLLVECKKRIENPAELIKQMENLL